MICLYDGGPLRFWRNNLDAIRCLLPIFSYIKRPYIITPFFPKLHESYDYLDFIDKKCFFRNFSRFQYFRNQWNVISHINVNPFWIRSIKAYEICLLTYLSKFKSNPVSKRNSASWIIKIHVRRAAAEDILKFTCICVCVCIYVFICVCHVSWPH